MATIKISKSTVDAISPSGKTAIHYDRDLKGFGVRVTASGHKTWIVEYRPGGGGRRVSSRRMSLGSTEALTADQARKAARDVLAKARLGADPAKERQVTRGLPTVKEFSKDFMEEHVKAKLRASTAKSYQCHFDLHILPEIGSMKIDQVKRSDVSRLHRKVGKKKPGAANRMLATLSSMYGYAASEEILSEGCNPVREIELFEENFMERYLTTDEIGRLGQALIEAETIGLPWTVDETKVTTKHAPKEENRRTVIDPYAADALRLLLLTGARSSEILGLRWEYVDLERGLLLLPDSKTGKKVIILNAPALEILSSITRIGPYVIAGKDPKKPRYGLAKPWGRILRRAGIAHARIHDLRHTHASFGINSGLSLAMIGRLLGHLNGKTTARYSHLADDPTRKASDQIGGLLSTALTGERPAVGQ